MAVMSLLARCGLCDRTFTANASLVPCFPCDNRKPLGITRLSPTGVRTPVCQDCFNAINKLRTDNGLSPQVAMPGAYEPEDA